MSPIFSVPEGSNWALHSLQIKGAFKDNSARVSCIEYCFIEDVTVSPLSPWAQTSSRFWGIWGKQLASPPAVVFMSFSLQLI